MKHIIKHTKGKNFATVEIKLIDGNLSICGTYGRTGARDIDGAGQCIDTIVENFPDFPKIKEIESIWKEWHLNNLQAGCEHQRELGWAKYDDHPCEPCPVCGYKYGTKWLKKELPADVVKTVESWGNL